MISKPNIIFQPRPKVEQGQAQLNSDVNQPTLNPVLYILAHGPTSSMRLVSTFAAALAFKPSKAVFEFSTINPTFSNFIQ